MELAAVPRPRDCRQLTGQEDVYRIRVGVYRVIYSIEDRRIVVVVLERGHRKDIYSLSAPTATGCAVKMITRDLNRPRVQILPGEVLLEEFLRPAALTQVEAARRMDIPLNRLNEIVRSRRAIMADTALRLAALFNMSPEFWMNLQASWDLHQARLAMKKAG